MEKEILENMPTPELDELLNAELRKEIPDGDLVRTIVCVLKDRESDQPMEISPELQAVWDKYEARYQRRAERPRPTARTWVMKAIATGFAAVFIFVILTVIPLPARAETWREKLTRWTDTVLELFTFSEATEPHAEYEFITDNPGLQKVYDAVVELGVTEPVVPMWIPDGYELRDFEVSSLADKVKLVAYFTNGKDSLILKLDILGTTVWHEYHKSDVECTEYEYAGTKHHVIKNGDRWTIVWEKKNVECCLSSGQEDIYRIIQSIYGEDDTQ